MAKYSKEQRRCAVELYVRYECCAADMVVLLQCLFDRFGSVFP